MCGGTPNVARTVRRQEQHTRRQMHTKAPRPVPGRKYKGSQVDRTAWPDEKYKGECGEWWGSCPEPAPPPPDVIIIMSRCGAVAVQLWCSCGAVVVQLWCSCGAVAVQLRCSRGAVAVQSRCSCGAVAVQLRCSCGAVVVQLWCSCGAAVVQLDPGGLSSELT